MALHNIKADPVAFSQRLEAFSLNSREVNEHIGAIVLLDETKTFCVIEPLNCTFCHFSSSFPRRGVLVVQDLRCP